MLATGASPGREPDKANRPNIILIMADDIAYDNNFGAYTSEDSWTPRLDKMASEGITFNHCYSTAKCTPSRVKIMTGRSGVRNYIRFGALDRSEITFATVLKDAGYKTFIAGKWQLDGPGGTETKDAGFDSWLLWNTKVASGSRYWDPKLERDGRLLKVDKDTYGPDMCVDAITRFIKDNKKRPFLVYYPMLLVHSPFLPTPDSNDRNETDKQKNFKDMAKYMDKCVGRILDCLEGNGLSKNTVVMFTTDNGTHRGIRYRSRGKDVFGKKGIPHDRGTHAPLIIRHPEATPPSVVCDDLVDFSDFMPTLAEIAGAKLPDITIDGYTNTTGQNLMAGFPMSWARPN
jgi:arylsulfatase A